MPLTYSKYSYMLASAELLHGNCIHQESCNTHLLACTAQKCRFVQKKSQQPVCWVSIRNRHVGQLIHHKGNLDSREDGCDLFKTYAIVWIDLLQRNCIDEDLFHEKNYPGGDYPLFTHNSYPAKNSDPSLGITAENQIRLHGNSVHVALRLNCGLCQI